MKRFLTILATLLLSGAAAQAGDISVATARKIAAATLGTDNLTLESEGSEFYIFNASGGGFAIISGTEALDPVLAYSPDGRFGTGDDAPEALRAWMSEGRTAVRAIRKNAVQPTAEQKSKWDRATRRTSGTSNLLSTATWGQGTPCNNLCPVDDVNGGERSCVGCAALAMSIIAHYHRHPSNATGTVGGYTSEKNGFTTDIPLVDLSTISYDYDHMLSTYKNVSYTAEQAAAVATLCYSVAVTLNMQFSAKASSTTTVDNIGYFVQDFDFDQGYLRYDKNYLTDTEWTEVLETEIDAERPVLVTGYVASGGGHAFVVDGYDSSDRMHVNWGWDGSSNGYYDINAFRSYTKNLAAYTNLKPNEGGSASGRLYMKAGGDYSGLQFLSGNMYKDSTFTVSLGRLYNYSSVAFTPQISFQLCSADGTIKKQLSYFTAKEFTTDSKAYPSISLKLGKSTTLNRGDYIQVFYRCTSSDEWEPVYYDLDPDSGVQGKLYPNPGDYASMEYDKGTGYLTVTFIPGEWSYCTLKNSSGESVGVKTYDKTNGIIVINTAGKPAGTYTLTLYHGGYEDTGGTKHIIGYGQSAEIQFTIAGTGE